MCYAPAGSLAQKVSMKPLPRSLICVMLLLATGAAGCENLSTGPTLANVVISALGKQPTTDQKDVALCCCRAVGTVTNLNTVPVYVSMTLTSFDLRDIPIQKVLWFVPDVAPGQTAPIDAPGFVVPCNGISHFVPEVKVRGLTDPPL